MAIELNDNIRVNAGKPSEPKYLNTSNIGYANTAEVLSQIPIAQRHEGLIVKVGSSLYWFRDGVADINLMPFAVGSSYSFANGLTESGGSVKLGGTLTENTTIGLNGNPVILSTVVHTSTVQANVIFNNNDMFNSFHVSSNFLEKGYIEIELECITATTSINYIASTPLNLFYISLIIIDEDPELTKDLTLAPPIDYNNYNNNMPIRPY